MSARALLAVLTTLWRELGDEVERDVMTLFAQKRAHRQERCGGEGLLLDLPA